MKWSNVSSHQLVIPYARVKLDRLHARLVDEDYAAAISWQWGDGVIRLLKVVFFKMYPNLLAFWEVCVCVCVCGFTHATM